MSPVASSVSIVVPMLNEAAALPRLIRVLGCLHPAPIEIVAVDVGGHLVIVGEH